MTSVLDAASVATGPRAQPVRAPAVHRFSYPVIRTESPVPDPHCIAASYLAVVNAAGRRDSDEYGRETWIPVPTWQSRSLVRAGIDLQALELNKADTRRVLGIVRLPEQGMALLRSLAADPMSQRDAATFYHRGPGRALYDAIVAHTRSYAFRPDIKPMGVAEMAPGFLSTSVQGDSPLRVGMHIDCWDALPLNQRQHVRNRISWNIGREPRWLLLAPVHADLVYQMTQDDPQAPQVLPDAFKAWLRNQAAHRQTTPVFKVRINPGEGYLVSTDFWAHDGYTLGKRELDITLPFLGYFQMPTGSPAWQMAST